MKKYVGIFLILLAACLFAYLVGSHIALRHAQAPWLESASKTLASQPAPSAELIHWSQEGRWARQGYLVFSNGWASFACHTVHDSEEIGDIALLRTSDGVYYVSHFHFCEGELTFVMGSFSQPRDFLQFLEIFGSDQGWRKKKP